MSHWLEISKESEFTAPVKVVEYEGNSIAVFKLTDGYYAIENRCSHEDAFLSEGEILDDRIIECPLHGAQFDIRSGKNLSFPAVVPVKSYPVKVEKGTIYLDVED